MGMMGISARSSASFFRWNRGQRTNRRIATCHFSNSEQQQFEERYTREIKKLDEIGVKVHDFGCSLLCEGDSGRYVSELQRFLQVEYYVSASNFDRRKRN